MTDKGRTVQMILETPQKLQAIPVNYKSNTFNDSQTAWSSLVCEGRETTRKHKTGSIYMQSPDADFSIKNGCTTLKPKSGLLPLAAVTHQTIKGIEIWVMS